MLIFVNEKDDNKGSLAITLVKTPKSKQEYEAVADRNSIESLRGETNFITKKFTKLATLQSATKYNAIAQQLLLLFLICKPLRSNIP